MVDLLKKSSCLGEDTLLLPNGVDVLSNGSVVVADAGHDRICLFGPDGTFRRCQGGLGFGKYRMKEPVAVAVSSEDEIYVADWHNHRVVRYSDNLKYQTEFGHYGRIDQSSVNDYFVSAAKFYYKLSRTGTYRRYFFSDDAEWARSDASMIDRIRLFLEGFSYWTLDRHASVLESLDTALRRGYMNKPNGIAFVGTTVYVTQKNARCVTIHRNTNKRIEFVGTVESAREGEAFGRLANVHSSSTSDRLYVCDERRNIIWIVDSGGEYIDELRNIGDERFLPFSCCELGENFLAISSGKDLLIISLDEKTIVYQENLGELHGVEFDEKNELLYVVERSNDRILVYDVYI